MAFRFFFITNAPDLARYVVGQGVERIFVDLEILGKEARQGHLSTVISRHDIDDVSKVRRAIPGHELMVRVNPLNSHSQHEIDAAVGAGADILMLPMFRTRAEVEEFAARTARRARICLLAETAEALSDLGDCAAVEGIDEVHIGLNDLSLDLGFSFMFEPLATPLIEEAAAALNRIGTPFGIGGLARVGEGLLPAELILGEHVRLGSTAAILSRTFHRQALTRAEMECSMSFADEIAKLRDAYRGYQQLDGERLELNRQELVGRIEQIAESIGASNANA